MTRSQRLWLAWVVVVAVCVVLLALVRNPWIVGAVGLVFGYAAYSLCHLSYRLTLDGERP